MLETTNMVILCAARLISFLSAPQNIVPPIIAMKISQLIANVSFIRKVVTLPWSFFTI